MLMSYKFLSRRPAGQSRLHWASLSIMHLVFGSRNVSQGLLAMADPWDCDSTALFEISEHLNSAF